MSKGWHCDQRVRLMQKGNIKKIRSTLIKALIGGVIFYFVCSNLILWAHHFFHAETKVIHEGAKVKR